MKKIGIENIIATLRNDLWTTSEILRLGSGLIILMKEYETLHSMTETGQLFNAGYDPKDPPDPQNRRLTQEKDYEAMKFAMEWIKDFTDEIDRNIVNKEGAFDLDEILPH